MILRDINVRPMRGEDVAEFEAFRRMYWDGDLELPKGWAGPSIETAVAESADGHKIASLTGTISILMDPLVRNPQIRSGPELVAAIYALERTMAYMGQKMGAVDSYIAIPDHLEEYHRIVEKAGYVETVKGCKVFRRPLRPDTHPLIGPELEAQRRIILTDMNTKSETKSEAVE